jgi:hypothetical protein
MNMSAATGLATSVAPVRVNDNEPQMQIDMPQDTEGDAVSGIGSMRRNSRKDR